MPTPTVEVPIRAIGAGGFGVGSLPNGKVIFVPRAAPGDQVRVKIVKEKGRWARGEALEWLEEGPSRRQAPCPRYAECDGCSLQHVDYEEQLRWKARFVGDALRRLGGLDAADPPVVPSPQEVRYRNKITFTLRRLPGGRTVAGFRELGHRGRVLDVGRECLLPEVSLGQVWDDLRNGWGPNASRLPEGRELRLTLRSGLDHAGLLVRGGRGSGTPGALLDEVPGLGSIWKETKGGDLRHLAGEETLQAQWGDEVLRLRGRAFLQVNQHVGEALFEHVLEQAGEVGGERIVDAYCGVGTMGRALARKGAEVAGIEIDPEAARAADWNPCPGFAVITGRVERELRGLLPASLVLLNPPRTGLAEGVPRVLNSHVAERLVYVSCDPATLARDLKRLGEAYHLESVLSFDLFPQTAHVETVVSLTGRTGKTS